MARRLSPQPSPKICQILYTLRSVRQPLLTIVSFVTSYFIYWHYVLLDPVPAPLILLLIACAFVFLESHFFNTYPLLQNYALLFKTNTLGSVFLSSSYITLWLIVGFGKEKDDYFKPMRETQGWKLSDAGVEEHHKTLVQVLVFVGATSVLCSLLIIGVVALGSWRARNRSGYIVLEEGGPGGEIEDEDEILMENIVQVSEPWRKDPRKIIESKMV